MEHSFYIQINQLSKAYNSNNERNAIFALKDVSFRIKPGEVVSLIGSNGSGKSTLLSILSGLIKPSAGSVEINGSVIAILEIGSNFHPDLTGEENAKLFYVLQGIPENKIENLVKEAHVFSGLEAYFFEPIKHYSQGMFVRLAASTAFLLDADIYLFDEVLSVGDDAFRMKIDNLIKEIKAKGKIVIFASHNKQEVASLSNVCVWLDKGEIKAIDHPQKLIPLYTHFQRVRYEKQAQDDNREEQKIFIYPKESQDGLIVEFNKDEFSNEFLEFRKVEIKGESPNLIFKEEKIFIKIDIFKKKESGCFSVQLKVKNELDQAAFFSLSLYNQEQEDLEILTDNYSGLLSYYCEIPASFMMNGTYFLNISVGKRMKDDSILFAERAYVLPPILSFNVRSKGAEFINDQESYSIFPALKWQINK